MSYSIQNKLCDDVLGLVKSFRGKTQKEILFSECLEDLNNNENLKDYLRTDWGSPLPYPHIERFTRNNYETSYINKNGIRKYTTHTYLFTQDGTQIR